MQVRVVGALHPEVGVEELLLHLAQGVLHGGIGFQLHVNCQPVEIYTGDSGEFIGNDPFPLHDRSHDQYISHA